MAARAMSFLLLAMLVATAHSAEPTGRAMAAYWVLGSFAEAAKAELERSRLSRALAMEVLVVGALVQNREYHRLLVVIPSTDDERAQLRARLAGHGIADTWTLRLPAAPVARRASGGTAPSPTPQPAPSRAAPTRPAPTPVRRVDVTTRAVPTPSTPPSRTPTQVDAPRAGILVLKGPQRSPDGEVDLRAIR